MISTPLAIVTNRQPYRHEYASDDGGDVTVDRPCGGVVAALDTVAQRHEATWIAWGDGEADREVCDPNDRITVPPDDPAYTLERVWLDEEDVKGYYEGYANRVLWPLCHGAMGAFEYDVDHWLRYRDVNRQFAERVRETVDEGATVWFQDYHFALAPAMIRDAVDGPLVHFWHIPWPPADIFRYCPQRQELLEGLLATDLLGFHVEEYVERFLDCVEAFVPDARVDRNRKTVKTNGQSTRLSAFPLGVDVESIAREASQAHGIESSLRDRYNIKGQLLLGVDRLDYTKGIPERLRAIEHLLERSPRHRCQFTVVQKSIPSRENIPAYQRLQSEVEQVVDRINDRFATDDWQPVVTIDDYLPTETLYGLYRATDVMLVTPICDGMNLVAQEFVAAQSSPDGVLVLSEFAGAHEFLGDGVLSINPYDTPAHADAIERAIDMGVGERMRRMRELRSAVDELDIETWAPSVLAATSSIDDPPTMMGIE